MCLAKFAECAAHPYKDDPHFLHPEQSNLNLRRNAISLFDNMKNEVVRLDTTIGVSLLDRNEQDRISHKLETAHPSIPNAFVKGVDPRSMGMRP